MSEVHAARVDGAAQVVAELRRANNDDLAIVLVGSAARNVRTEESDIDLLLVGRERPSVPKCFPGFHIQSSSMQEFLRTLQNGEDFESWCVRLGVPLFDGGQWAEILGSEEAKNWPRWELKVAHGARRLFLASEFIEMGDDLAASEELVYTLGHIARGLLLKAGTFPLSRPELAGQIRTLGYPHLATLHEQLRGNGVDRRLLGQARTYSKRLLCHLDRDAYGACATEYRRKQRAKRNRRPA
jgi:predicted nucleotidyltransferase